MTVTGQILTDLEDDLGHHDSDEVTVFSRSALRRGFSLAMLVAVAARGDELLRDVQSHLRRVTRGAPAIHDFAALGSGPGKEG